jgi:hypothetical protein
MGLDRPCVTVHLGLTAQGRGQRAAGAPEGFSIAQTRSWQYGHRVKRLATRHAMRPPMRGNISLAQAWKNHLKKP